MRILPAVALTAQQLPIVAIDEPGVMVIRGAAGSGKTTTALMRLRQLCVRWLGRRRRLGRTDNVRVLVLTYNRTLEGYIEELARQQVAADPALELRVDTFAKFARDLVGGAPLILENWMRKAWLDAIIARSSFTLDAEFLRDETDYVLGRFDVADLEDYIGSRREGRGTTPRMDRARRRLLIDEVIRPYIEQKKAGGYIDWNDLAEAASHTRGQPWDVIIVDEAQDFSAKEIRAIMRQAADEHSVTFVFDAAQRIYPRSYTWKEVGLSIRPEDVKALTENYRNTAEIAAFARPIIEGVPMGDDGALPDFKAAAKHGPLPTVLRGKYTQQIHWAIQNIVKQANLADESVVFMQLWGGDSFDTLKGVLNGEGIAWVQLQRNKTWPGGDETVAISTLHSAKGLEFDHVVIIGLNQRMTRHGAEEDDAQLSNYRRLVAMGIGRARKTVTLGYKPEEQSTLITYLAPGTFRAVRV